MRITEILDSVGIERPRCKVCGGDIEYSDTKIKYTRNGIKITGKSYLSFKKVGDKQYNLCVCEHCLKEKFNITKTAFNVMCETTKFAFDIPDDVYLSARRRYALSEDTFVSKYGEQDGKKLYKKYCERQAETNTFEYKKKKYGWTEEDFKKYNKSRAVTLNNMISKYGEQEGTKKFNEYVEKQKLTKSWDYMVEVFGEEKARQINQSKSLCLSTFIRKYGEEEGNKKYIEYCNNRSNQYSYISQLCFDELDKYIGQKYNTYYATKNTEYCVRLDDHAIFLDYYIPELNIAIEFNGTNFHGDPRVYEDDAHCNPFNKTLTAKEIREKDEKRYIDLFNKFGIVTYIIWELDYDNNWKAEDFIRETLKLEIC